jgi:hypothetical protein
MSVRRAQEEIGSREFCEWVAFNRLDPIGLERADVNAALVATVIANANRDPAKRAEPFALRDFMVVYGGAEDLLPEQQSDETIAAKLKVVLAPFRAKGK